MHLVQLDPNEKVNLANQRTEVTDELQAEIADFLDQPVAEWGEPPEVELDEMHKAQLRALGYALPATEAIKKKKNRNRAAAQRRAAKQTEARE